MSDQEKEVTQPVTVNGSIPAHSPEEGTQPVKVTPEASISQLPGWLLKFASSPEQSVEETQPGATPDLEIPFLEDTDEGNDFIPPEISGKNEWQEITDFHDQEKLDLETDLENQEFSAEVEAIEEADTAPEAELVEGVAESIAVDPQVEAAEAFGQEVRDLLKQGKHDKALVMIRENMTDPLMAEAAKKTLRSQLTLASKSGDLWDVYDELNSSSL